MFKSLRWRLQAWHALILLLAVAGFGTVLYLEISKARFDEIDGELVAAARNLDGVLRVVPRPILQNGFRRPPPDDASRPMMRARPAGDESFPDSPPIDQGYQNQRPGAPRPEPGDIDRPPEGRGFEGDRPPPRDGRPPPREPPPRRADFEGRPRPGERSEANDGEPIGPDQFGPPERNSSPGQGPPGERNPPPRAMSPEQVRRILTLPRPFVERFTEGGQGPYFRIWAANGEVIREEAVPRTLPPPTNLPRRPDKDFRAQQRGNFREVIVEGPEQTRVLVGRTIAHETAELNKLFWALSITGASVFAIGLVGGWWLSGRAVKPIEKMSKTAASISAKNLSQRIDVADVDSELAALGNVLNAMFDRLQAAIDDQMRFTADASHELRTPLSVIFTHAEVALNRVRTADDYRETLETCLRAARRMKLLVEDLLILARADAGKLQLRMVNVDLKQMLEDCTAMLAPMAAERHVNVCVSGSKTTVKGDPDRLSQLVTNLMTNAIAYNVEGGSVTAETSTMGQDVVMTITDAGVGISPNDLPHIFERFYRVDKARSRSTGGNGLGLAICKSIVEAHGGTIEVSSRVGTGTTFTTRLSATAQGNGHASDGMAGIAASNGAPASRVTAELGRSTTR